MNIDEDPDMAETSDCTDVCSLPPDQLRERLAMVRREIIPHVRRTEKRSNGLACVFAPDPAMEAKLRHLIELETLCCSSLAWSVESDPTAGTLRLVIDGVDPDSGFFDSIVASAGDTTAEAKPAAAGSRVGGRAAKAGVVGITTALSVCCFLPAAIAAVGGAAAAAPLASLDRPDVILGAAIATAIPAWIFLGRRRAAECGPGC